MIQRANTATFHSSLLLRLLMIPLFSTVTAIRLTRQQLYWTTLAIFLAPKLNPSKTKALWLRSWRHRQDKPFGFHWPEKPTRALGSFISYDGKENEKYNFTLKLQKLKTILDICNCRSLALFGRCLITKSHSISSLDAPLEYLGVVNSAIFKFILEK